MGKNGTVLRFIYLMVLKDLYKDFINKFDELGDKSDSTIRQNINLLPIRIKTNLNDLKEEMDGSREPCVADISLMMAADLVRTNRYKIIGSTYEFIPIYSKCALYYIHKPEDINLLFTTGDFSITTFFAQIYIDYMEEVNMIHWNTNFKDKNTRWEFDDYDTISKIIDKYLREKPETWPIKPAWILSGVEKEKFNEKTKNLPSEIKKNLKEVNIYDFFLQYLKSKYEQFVPFDNKLPGTVLIAKGDIKGDIEESYKEVLREFITRWYLWVSAHPEEIPGVNLLPWAHIKERDNIGKFTEFIHRHFETDEKPIMHHHFKFIHPFGFPQKQIWKEYDEYFQYIIVHSNAILKRLKEETKKICSNKQKLEVEKYIGRLSDTIAKIKEPRHTQKNEKTVEKVESLMEQFDSEVDTLFELLKINRYEFFDKVENKEIKTKNIKFYEFRAIEDKILNCYSNNTEILLQEAYQKILIALLELKEATNEEIFSFINTNFDVPVSESSIPVDITHLNKIFNGAIVRRNGKLILSSEKVTYSFDVGDIRTKAESAITSKSLNELKEIEPDLKKAKDNYQPTEKKKELDILYKRVLKLISN